MSASAAAVKGSDAAHRLGFTGASEKAMAAHRASTHPRHYFDWTEMLARRQKSFVGTVPTTLFYGLQEALRLMLVEEGLDNVRPPCPPRQGGARLRAALVGQQWPAALLPEPGALVGQA